MENRTYKTDTQNQPRKSDGEFAKKNPAEKKNDGMGGNRQNQGGQRQDQRDK